MERGRPEVRLCSGKHLARLLVEASAPKRLAFIIPFLGSWPKWTALFFESCRFNPSIAILLACDIPPPFALPPNVQVIRMTKTDIVSRLEQATGLTLSHVSGHKLCEFKPFYGLAFADILKPYEFWGYCDVDIMFGDLRRLLTDEFLDSIDIFSAQHDQFAGHFTIIRNIDLMNRAGFHINNWRELCLTSETNHLDEIEFCEAVRRLPTARLKQPQSLALELNNDFVACGVTFGFFGRIVELDKRAAPVVEWKEGSVLYHGDNGRTRQVLYVHFMATKHWWHWLLWTDAFRSGSTHYFSRVGYGGPKSATSLKRLRWRCFYCVQTGLTWAKRACGSILRQVLPSATFISLRRRLFALVRQ